MFSIYEGVHKIMNPEPVERFYLGLGILLFSICLEGGATIGTSERSTEGGRTSRSLATSIAPKTPTSIVLLGENSAAVVGLSSAMVALFAALFDG